MSFDDYLDLDGAVKELVDRLVDERGADWVIEHGDRLEEATKTAVLRSLTDATPLVEGLRGKAPQMLKERRGRRNDYRDMVEGYWCQAFDLYEMVLRIGLEAAEDFGESRAERRGESRVFVILTRLHARGCRIAEEILVLLKNGYGQGALARWRSLHEVTCVAMFIVKHGEDVAERYLLHDEVESWRASEDYVRCAPRLGYEPLAEGELEEARERAQRLQQRFGKQFCVSTAGPPTR